MIADLAALTPPLVVCAAFIIGVVIFMRHQMIGKRRPDTSADPDEPAGTKDRPA